MPRPPETDVIAVPRPLYERLVQQVHQEHIIRHAEGMFIPQQCCLEGLCVDLRRQGVA